MAKTGVVRLEPEAKNELLDLICVVLVILRWAKIKHWQWLCITNTPTRQVEEMESC